MSTKIEWAEETWNPITGCTKVSPGCKNCYAERMSKRLAGRSGYPAAPHNFDVTLHPDKLEQPLHWKKPRRVFVCSMGDLFHEDVSPTFTAAMWYVMREAQQHTFIILTKRPERMYKFTTDFDMLLPNVIGMVTAENQEQADKRIPWLLKCPFAVRGVSIEPMLGPVDPSDYWGEPGVGLDWIICGGETGSGARTLYPEWAHNLKGQCVETGVPFFFKRWGGSNKSRLLDGQMWNEYPERTES